MTRLPGPSFFMFIITTLLLDHPLKCLSLNDELYDHSIHKSWLMKHVYQNTLSVLQSSFQLKQ